MWEGIGEFAHDEKFIRYKIATECGQSGGPIICKKTQLVVGIHLGSNGQSNKALKLSNYIRNSINKWITEKFKEEVGSLDLKKKNIKNIDLKVLIENNWDTKIRLLNLETNHITH